MTYYSDHQYLFDILVPIVHEPLRPARNGTIGEVVYSTQWKALMETLPHPDAPDCTRLADILNHLPMQIEQRHATAAASFVCWLGTNCGRSFLMLGKRAAEGQRPLNKVKAWLGEWAWENARVRGVNHGTRTVEHCLAPADHMGSGGLSCIPDLSVTDYEVIDHVVMWLASLDGERFIEHCEKEIELRKQLEQTKHYMGAAA